MLALAVAGCGGGGSKGLSKEDYGAKLNQICATTVKKAGLPSSLPELVSKGPALIAEFDRALPQAEALEPPGDLKQDAEKFLSEYRQLRNLVSQLIAAAKKNDLGTVAQAAGKADALGKDTAALARKLGAPACAQR